MTHYRLTLKFFFMRLIFLFLVAIPFISTAQINRSATELAKEKIQDYIITKIFRGLSYKPLSYGELQNLSIYDSRVSWSILHKFEIVDSQYVSNKRRAVQKPYFFSFYLDKKLNVISAESYVFE